MALFQIPELKKNIYFWHITEGESELIKNLNFPNFFKLKFQKIKSIQKKKQYLAVHKILRSINIDLNSLYYDENGRPLLKNGNYISISHSYNYCGVITGHKKVGLDIEKLRPKILDVSSKFLSKSEELLMEKNIKNLTKVWTVKESLFKAFGQSSISFKNNIIINEINSEFTGGKASIQFEKKIEEYDIEITNFSQYICSVVSKIN